MFFFIVKGPSINYVRTWGRGGVKRIIHFYCIFHAKRGEEVQKACKNVYVINGRPQSAILAKAAVAMAAIAEIPLYYNKCAF